ncbi:MAG: rod shape-determining protein MreD [Candidatus Eisenbacteria bacterium]|nr:rod shape-determining protein MreD [Candidatus Eisenbacteria bacterium]
MRKEVVVEILTEAGYLLLAFVLQASVVSYFAIGEMKADLILGALVYVSISKRPMHSTIVGFLVGVLQDMGFGGWIGINAFSKCLLALLVSHASRSTFKERYWTQLVLLLSTVMLHDLVYFGFLYGGGVSQIGSALLKVSVGSAVLTALVSPAYDFIIRRVFSLKGPVSRESVTLPREQ